MVKLIERIIAMNKEIMKALGFTKEVELVENNQCPACKQHINGKADFKNEISWKEYQISGLCQECQDAIFG
jgi:hypothetical protein